MSWGALQNSAAWAQWHELSIALRWFLAASDTERLTGILEDFGASFPKAAMNQPVAEAVREANAATGAGEMLVRRADRFLAWHTDPPFRSMARAFIAALVAESSPDRLLWMIGNFTDRARIPTALLHKSSDAFAAFAKGIRDLRRGLRDRDADAVVGAVLAAGIEFERFEIGTRAPNMTWLQFWYHVEWEALNRLFIWPLFYDRGRSDRAIALPISIEASPGGRRVKIIRGQRLAPDDSPSGGQDERSGASFQTVARQSADIARELVLAHSRHLSEQSRLWIAEASFTVDFRPADAVLGLADLYPGISDSSLSLLLATCFAARLLARDLPLVAMSGDILSGARHPLRGPTVEGVEAIGSKLVYAASINLFALAVRPADRDAAGGDSAVQPASPLTTGPIPPLMVRPVATLADAFDVCFTKRWRRHRRERLPASLGRQPPGPDAVGEFLRQAPPVAKLPANWRADDLLEYVHRATRAVSRGSSPPPGIVSAFAALMPEDSGMAGLALFDGLCGFETSASAGHYPHDRTGAAGWLRDRLQLEVRRPLLRAPDLICLIAPATPREEWQSDHLVNILGDLDLRAPTRDPRWREWIGDARVVIADPAPAAGVEAVDLAPAERESLNVLSLFRSPFTNAQALAVLSTAGIAEPKSCYFALQEARRVVPSLTPGLWQCTVRVEPNPAPDVTARVHRKIAQTLASVKIAHAPSGWSAVEAENSLNTAEAVHHFIQACTSYRLSGQMEEMEESATSLALLLAMHSATPDCLPIVVAHCKSSEPFVHLAREHWDQGWRPQGKVALALATLVANRWQEHAVRRTVVAGIGADEDALRALLLDFVAFLCSSSIELPIAAGATSSLLGRSVVPAAHRAALESILDRALASGDDAAIIHVAPDLLCRKIARHPRSADRHREYLRSWSAGHQSHAGLLLAAIGTAGSTARAEAVWAECGSHLSAAGIRWIVSLKWRESADVCQSDFQHGYGWLTDLALVDQYSF